MILTKSQSLRGIHDTQRVLQGLGMGIRRSADEMGMSLGEMMHRHDPVMMHTWRNYAVGCGVNDPGLLLQGDDLCVRECEKLIDAGVLPRSAKSRTFYLVVRDMFALGDTGRSSKGQVHEEWHHMLEPNGATLDLHANCTKRFSATGITPWAPTAFGNACRASTQSSKLSSPLNLTNMSSIIVCTALLVDIA